MDTIFINRLRFNCILGIYPQERINSQPIEIDLEMQTDIRPAAQTENLELSLNYAEISERIIAFSQQRKAELIETLAEELTAHLLDDYPLIDTLTLSIHKPVAVPQAASVGVRITRRRN